VVDIQPTGASTQPISDDQELAKALAGIADEPAAQVSVGPVTGVPAPAPVAPVAPAPIVAPMPAVSPSGVVDLDSLKQVALGELRPLIGHVDLPADEKFDTYLMLIRSTDDATLIAPAHDIAQSIKDDDRRAQALLDIIKEIDFLSRKDETTGK
jgi:hypothetical protein